MVIQLTPIQVQKFENWKSQFKPLPYLGATGGHFGLQITFTSIGNVVYGINWKGDKIDLTEYENF